MNKFAKFNYLVINSKEEPILFQLSNQGNLKYIFLNKFYKPIKTSKLFKYNVLKYSASIDKIDKIHLITLMKSGELNYSVYENDSWTNTTISQFDFHSKIYSNISVLVNDNNINIIYGYANLNNSKLWTICHIVGNNENWDQHNVIKFATDRTSIPFVVDIDSSNSIQLLYRSIKGNVPQIYHIFYNPYTKKWNSTPQKVTLTYTNKLLPYIFVDTKDNIHALWLEEISKNYILKYSRLSSTGDNKYIWTQIKIPYIPNCNDLPIIFEDNGTLKIIYSKTNSIGYIYSSDYGGTWFEGEALENKCLDINCIKISNLMLKSKNIKINDIYCSLNESLNFFFLDSIQTENLISSNIIFSDIQNNSNYPISEEKIDLDKIFKSQEEIKDILYKNLDLQNDINKKVQYMLKILETKKSSLLDKFFK
ncbi:hypothetical protein K8M07_00365 [Schnuerera sp. xch1]|uniref:hypothetical protein n=1 Tax=Schnuerera sp. xch1 TaxID=2874283 RepID=UPI001CBB80A9|nr:hypothetical protein [Schnuerera sp. xch1]MBZ2173702.1 hypothetical protein [Schnuerera sp. xch1]